MSIHVILCALLLAACVEIPNPEGAALDSFSDDDLAARALASGISGDQALELVALGVPVVVPVVDSTWRQTAFQADVFEDFGYRYPEYEMSYQRSDGVCFSIRAATEGVGDVFVLEPPNDQEVEVPGISTYGPVLMGWNNLGVPIDDFSEGDALYTEWFGADGVAVGFVSSSDEEGCLRIDPTEAIEILQQLRYLNPQDDVEGNGTFSFLNMHGLPAMSPTPEEAVEGVWGSTETAYTLDIASQRDHHAIVYIIWPDVMDDSVRSERIRVVVQNTPQGWGVLEAGKQIRCHDGRGHAGWGTDSCV